MSLANPSTSISKTESGLHRYDRMGEASAIPGINGIHKIRLSDANEYLSMWFLRGGYMSFCADNEKRDGKEH